MRAVVIFIPLLVIPSQVPPKRRYLSPVLYHGRGKTPIFEVGDESAILFLGLRLRHRGPSHLIYPNKTSQICSVCHKEGEHKDPSVRTYVCIHCGLVLDRDQNTAINIL